MRRRNFIKLIGGGAIAWPLGAHAQQTEKTAKIPRIGVLWHAGSAEEENVYLPILTKAFNDLGYIEGKNIELDHRFPAEQPDRFQALARELVGSKVDVIVATTAMGALAVKQATSTIPTVFVIVADPVGDRLVESLGHPGGNMTGLSLMGVDLIGKRLAQFKEAVPNLSRVALIFDPREPTSQRVVSAYFNAAKTLGLSLRPVEIASPDGLEEAFFAIARAGEDGVAVVASSMMVNERARIGSSAMAQKMPAVVGVADMVTLGVLMSYGSDLADFVRKSVVLVDRILKGEKPANLPVEQPTHFKLVINLRTAKALGLTSHLRCWLRPTR